MQTDSDGAGRRDGDGSDGAGRRDGDGSDGAGRRDGDGSDGADGAGQRGATRLSRRGVLAGGVAAGVVAACSTSKRTASRPSPSPPPPTSSAAPSPATAAASAPALPAGVFALGVASGDPLPDGVVLWTRLAPAPLHDGGMPAADVPVEWQVARDERFGSLAASGTATATATLAHSVHADARGLAPATDYFYRFRAGGQVSPTGRTRTAPAAGSSPARLRLAVVNCQDWQNGYWPAYAALAKEDLDAVLHVGDYIYEYDPKSAFPDRLHTRPQTLGLNQLTTLSDYRNRHAQYKTDPALQAAHASHPFIVTWDDHEVENNYTGLIDEVDDKGRQYSPPAVFARQRAAAYQAYYEHMPIRAPYTVGSPDYLIYRRFSFGDLATVNVLDTRQYRTDQPCHRIADFGPVSCGIDNSTGTMTGPTQEKWLRDGLTGSRARWNVIAQQTMMAQLNLTANGSLSNLDQVDGYRPYRRRLLEMVHASRARNPVVLSGDIHSAWVSDLKPDFDDPRSPVVASEFVAMAVSSSFFLPEDAVRKVNAELSPHIRYFSSKHGYLRLTAQPDHWQTDLRVVQTIARRDAPISTLSSWAVENGRPGPVPA